MSVLAYELEMPLDADSYYAYFGVEGRLKVYSLYLSDLWIAIWVYYLCVSCEETPTLTVQEC